MKYLKLSHFNYFITKRFYQNGEVRVRFAPSPTGFLHLGGLRTALYNYFFSKSQNGTFILRVEDTDQTRLVEGAIEKLEYDLKWAGIEPDEGPSKNGSYGPYLQSQRLALYKNEVQKLLDNDTAYYCFCTNKRLELLRRDALRRREIPKYDNRCRYLPQDEIENKLKNNSNYCIRFKLTPILEPFNDLVYGNLVNNIAAAEGDPVIMKSDGYPTYHFANIVDDHHMKITHVLRGVEWQASTTKHLLLYKAFNWTPPQYAHLPLILNTDGTKLSKRNNNMTVEAYRNEGIYPEALINLIVNSGGGFDYCETQNTSLIKSTEELIKMFKLNKLNMNNCEVQYHRLNEFNREVIKKKCSNEEDLKMLIKQIQKIIKDEFLSEKLILDDDKIKDLIVKNTDRISRLKDFVGSDFSYLWVLPSKNDVLKFDKKYYEILDPLIHELEKVQDFNDISFSNYFKTLSEKHEVNYPTLMKFLRIILSGLQKGPSIREIMIQLEKERVLQRLLRAKFLYQNKLT